MQWIEAAPRPANQAICPFHRQTNRSFRCSPAAPRLPLLLSLAGTTALCSSDSSDSCPAFLKSISGEGLSFIHLLALQLSKVQKKLEGRKSTSCQCKKCRQQQMNIDEKKEKCSMTSMKKEAAPARSEPSGKGETVAAA
ncbi:uncharacterized protein LOC116254777 isoform X2 [Nymphaea colorata]|uniref:uncharacterized protein LOC116254777 isoform X2 n=1 Tax=Nymphaea colorata TaxID=210225 RepID=UPI00129E9DFA|nr:uncharacterized protein LOC116254777 isoform X2 [Nymphaea colorata]